MMIKIDDNGFASELRHGELVDENVEEVCDDFDLIGYNEIVVESYGFINF